MIRICLAISFCLGFGVNVAAQDSGLPASVREMIIVIGTPGLPEYETVFGEWARQWKSVADSQRMPTSMIGLADGGEANDREQLLRSLQSVAENSEVEEFWLVLIGHGTYDGDQAKFNLRGPDIAAVELKKELESVNAQTVVINCASSSGPFINALSGSRRVVLTSTKSGTQYNFSRFGQYLSGSINDPAADLDKDGQTSVLEAFIAASAAVAEFYDSENRLASELALLDDNGDQLGTPADWYRGVRAIKTAKNGAVDGRLANRIYLVPSDRESSLAPETRAKREDLESKVEQLRSRKTELGEAEYYRQLESLMVQLARLGQ